MSLTALREELGRRPTRGLRWRVRDLTARLTTPLGTAGLAAIALLVGIELASFVNLPGTPLRRARSALAELRSGAHTARGEAALRSLQAERLRDIQGYSALYSIPADLAARIYDIANAEGLEPQMAFSLVKTESSFHRWAVSDAGAVGYTQIKPSTARWLDPSVTSDGLFDPDTNLHLGFRYLSLLLHQYPDQQLALLAYNRGPARVGTLLASGENPANGYAFKVLHGSE
jgi:soluble lytic murein transglycosylase-like protein